MKANHDKCHLFLRTEESSNIQIANFTIKSSKAKKIQGINLNITQNLILMLRVFVRKQTENSMLLQE